MTPVQAAYRAVIARKTLPHGQRPTDTHIKIMWFLAKWQHANPSHGKLAKAAHCSRRTVSNALRRLRDLGFLSWSARYVRLRAGHVARASNTYLFQSNLSGPSAPPPTVSKKEKKQSSFLARQSLPPCDRTAALQALARVRAAMEGRLLAGLGHGLALR